MKYTISHKRAIIRFDSKEDHIKTLRFLEPEIMANLEAEDEAAINPKLPCGVYYRQEGGYACNAACKEASECHSMCVRADKARQRKEANV